jgi:hypothetical protein
MLKPKQQLFFGDIIKEKNIIMIKYFLLCLVSFVVLSNTCSAIGQSQAEETIEDALATQYLAEIEKDNAIAKSEDIDSIYAQITSTINTGNWDSQYSQQEIQDLINSVNSNVSNAFNNYVSPGDDFLNLGDALFEIADGYLTQAQIDYCEFDWSEAYSNADAAESDFYLAKTKYQEAFNKYSTALGILEAQLENLNNHLAP